jgi:hypothetical protein
MSDCFPTHLVKISSKGTLTLSMPEMSDRYILIEHREGRVVISPYDLESAELDNCAVAQRDGQMTLLGSQYQDIPEV